MPDLVAIVSPGRPCWIIIRSAAFLLFTWRGLGQSWNPSSPSSHFRWATKFSDKHMGVLPALGLTEGAVWVGGVHQPDMVVQSELLFSVQMGWCMLWGEWVLTRPPRPRYWYMSPAGTAGFRYPPCLHPAMGPPPSCTGTRSMSWVRAEGRGKGGKKGPEGCLD